MPSSTSSSNARPIPPGDWRAIWLVTLAIAVASVWWCERTTRAHGQRPSVVDDPVWWAVSRHAVDGDLNAVAFVGTSRLQLAYSADAFAEAAPDLHGVQLSINGVPPFGILRDLAEDDQFVGVAVVDLIEWDLMRDDAYTAAQPYVDRSRAMWRAPGALANRELASLAQSKLAVLAVGGRELIAATLGQRRWPEPKWVVMERDRTFHGDYQLAQPAELAKRREKGIRSIPENVPSPTVWMGQALALDDLVHQIRARGGDVIFVHLPISGPLAAQADTKYPRHDYWDVFAAHTPAAAVHFKDVPALAKLECPDGMHLDQKDQTVATIELVRAVRARRLTKNPRSP